MLFISYLITLITEVPSGFLWGVRKAGDFLIIACINTITNPAVVLLSVYLNTHMPIDSARTALLLVELLVAAIEGLMFKRLVKSIHHPYMYSIQANVLSFTAGILLSMYVL